MRAKCPHGVGRARVGCLINGWEPRRPRECRVEVTNEEGAFWSIGGAGIGRDEFVGVGS